MSTRRLQDEIQKRHPFRCVEEEVTLNVLRTGDLFQLQYERLFRAYHLTPAQYNILRILRGEGAPLKILAIAARTLTVVPGITGLIDRLGAAGLVTRERSSEDRRAVFVSITPAGVALLSQLDEPITQLHHRLAGHLSGEEQRELIRLLEKSRLPLDAAGGGLG